MKRPGRPRRILVIEDNDDAREMLRVALTLEGHTVYEAADGHAGVVVARDTGPDTALIDVGLPGLDGYEVARRIRASANGNAMRLIAITGYGQVEDCQRALEAGFDAHLTKPVTPEQLAAALHEGAT
jgi:two-component system, sensor histidine kinase